MLKKYFDSDNLSAEDLEAILKMLTPRERNIIKILYYSQHSMNVRQIIDSFIEEVCDNLHPLVEKTRKGKRVSMDEIEKVKKNIRFSHSFINLSPELLKTLLKESVDCANGNVIKKRKTLVKYNVTRFPNYPTVEDDLKRLIENKLVVRREGTGKAKATYSLHPGVYLTIKKLWK